MQWRKLWKKCCDEVEFAEKLNTLPPEEQCRQLSLIAAEDRQCGRKLFLYLSAASVFEQVRERSAFELGQFEEEEVCRHLSSEHHFRIDPRRTVLTGLCDRCQEAKHEG